MLFGKITLANFCLYGRFTQLCGRCTNVRRTALICKPLPALLNMPLGRFKVYIQDIKTKFYYEQAV